MDKNTYFNGFGAGDWQAIIKGFVACSHKETATFIIPYYSDLCYHLDVMKQDARDQRLIL